MNSRDTVVPQADLAAAFRHATPDRTAGLGGLARRPSADTPEPELAKVSPATTPTPASGQPEATAGTQPHRTPTSPPAREQGTAPTPKAQTPQVPVTVYVPRRLRDSVTKERNRSLASGSPVTNAGIILQAIESAIGHLSSRDDDVAESLAGLFNHHPRKTREPGVQLGLRLEQRNLIIVDQLAAENTGGNRSLLVERALERRYRDNPSEGGPRGENG